MFLINMNKINMIWKASYDIWLDINRDNQYK